MIPSRFCCPAAIEYPAGAVSSLPVESLAVVQPAAFGGGGNGSGTERRLVLAAQTPSRRRRRDGVCAAKTSRRSVPDPFPPPPKAAGWTTARDSTGRDETAPAGYSIAAGQQKREGITPLTPVPRPLLLYVLALQGWRLCRLSPAPRGKSLRRSGSSLPRGPKGSLEPSTNLVAGQAAGPLGKPFASQNCPQLYQGESGGLEPSTKPVAGQAGATLHSLSP